MQAHAGARAGAHAMPRQTYEEADAPFKRDVRDGVPCSAGRLICTVHCVVDLLVIQTFETAALMRLLLCCAADFV